MRKYDVAIPLGNFCSASFHLRHNNLQLESYPFDWVGFDNVTIPATLVANGFKNYFIAEQLKRVEGENGNHLPYTQYPEHYLFYHCVEKDLPFDEACKKAKAMFERRIQRVYEYVESAKNVLFMNTSNEPVLEKDAVEAQKILQKRFPGKNIDVIVVDMKADYKGMEIKELNKNVTFVRLEFDNKKDLYSDKKEEFKAILKDRKLSSQKDLAKTLLHKKLFTVKRTVVNALCCLIPIKKVRKSIRKKLQISTQQFDNN